MTEEEEFIALQHEAEAAAEQAVHSSQKATDTPARNTRARNRLLALPVPIAAGKLMLQCCVLCQPPLSLLSSLEFMQDWHLHSHTEQAYGVQVKEVISSRRVGSLMRKETAQRGSQHLLSHQGAAVTPDCLSERLGASPLTMVQTPVMTPSRPATCRAAPQQTLLQLTWSTTRSMLAVNALPGPTQRVKAVIMKSQQPPHLDGLQMTRAQTRLARLGRWLRVCWLPWQLHGAAPRLHLHQQAPLETSRKACGTLEAQGLQWRTLPGLQRDRL